MSEILLPCPFCESIKIRVSTKRNKAGYFGDGAPAYYVTAYATCGHCHARGPVVSAERIPSTHNVDYQQEVNTLKDKAAIAWNRRAESTEIASLRKEYKALHEQQDEISGFEHRPLY